MRTSSDEFGNFETDEWGPCPDCGSPILDYCAQFDSCGCPNSECEAVFDPAFGGPTLYERWWTDDGQMRFRRKAPAPA